MKQIIIIILAACIPSFSSAKVEVSAYGGIAPYSMSKTAYYDQSQTADHRANIFDFAVAVKPTKHMRIGLDVGVGAFKYKYSNFFIYTSYLAKPMTTVSVFGDVLKVVHKSELYAGALAGVALISGNYMDGISVSTKSSTGSGYSLGIHAGYKYKINKTIAAGIQISALDAIVKVEDKEYHLQKMNPVLYFPIQLGVTVVI